MRSSVGRIQVSRVCKRVSRRPRRAKKRAFILIRSLQRPFWFIFYFAKARVTLIQNRNKALWVLRVYYSRTRLWPYKKRNNSFQVFNRSFKVNNSDAKRPSIKKPSSSVFTNKKHSNFQTFVISVNNRIFIYFILFVNRFIFNIPFFK